jgi:ribosomal protein L11 methyltransferase
MATYTALATIGSAAKASELGEALERVEPEPEGVAVFEMEDGSGLWEVGGYFDGPPDEVALSLIASAFGVGFAVSELPETDWVAKVRRELAPVEAGRFWLYGSHDADGVPAARVPLLIDASMAFGTGHHGTTLGCLRVLDRLADSPCPGPVLDLGCGTAVLAMAAAKLWETTIVASDVDPVAIDVARANLAANGVLDRVETLIADGLDHPRMRACAPYGLVLANILMGPLLELAPGIADVTATGGMAVLSGILNDQADEVMKRYASAGLAEAQREVIGDWTTLVLERRPT